MKWLLIILLFPFPFAKAQNSYVIEFKDKNSSTFSIDKPQYYLSLRAIERRQKHKIAITQQDLPVVQEYIDQVVAAGVIYVNSSKWLNQIAIETDDPATLAQIQQLPFVTKSKQVKRLSAYKPIQKKLTPTDYEEKDYGNSFDQIHIHEGEFLHNKGFRGNGLMVAIIDAGFYRYQKLPAFDSVRLTARVFDTYDFVDHHENVSEDDAHGMQCFSIMAANIPGKFIGSSPQATYLLYRSEDAATESPLEEQNWIAALERADSIGADIVTTSLGYNTFDNPAFNYTHSSLNGKTSMMSRAATIAARKGLLLLVAAGNEGAKEWKMITVPADADSILTVGAVDKDGRPASFTSFGPTADGRLSPIVASVGVAATISSTSGQIITGNGTSFATPNLAGFTACLWQAFPEFSNMEIIAAIQNSSDHKHSPDYRTGYGIPNFRLAFEDLSRQRTERESERINEVLNGQTMKVHPNPLSNKFTISLIPKDSIVHFFLYNSNGQLLFSRQEILLKDIPQQVVFDDFSTPTTGIYILRVSSRQENKTIKLIISK